MQFLCVGIGRVLSPPPPCETNGNGKKLTSVISSRLQGIKPPGILLDVFIVIFVNLCTYSICRLASGREILPVTTSGSQ